jgi:hypothetical protein
LFYYLLAIPYGLSLNPQVALVFQTSLNLISIYLTYRLGQEMFGSSVGLVSAALYAVFPSAVLSLATVESRVHSRGDNALSCHVLAFSRAVPTVDVRAFAPAPRGPSPDSREYYHLHRAPLSCASSLSSPCH